MPSNKKDAQYAPPFLLVLFVKRFIVYVLLHNPHSNMMCKIQVYIAIKYYKVTIIQSAYLSLLYNLRKT